MFHHARLVALTGIGHTALRGHFGRWGLCCAAFGVHRAYFSPRRTEHLFMRVWDARLIRMRLSGEVGAGESGALAEKSEHGGI